MECRGIDLTNTCTIGPYNGTRAIAKYRLAEANMLISVETVALCGGKMALCGVLPHTVDVDDARPQPDVAASLERSLEKHADVWAELSEY